LAAAGVASIDRRNGRTGDSKVEGESMWVWVWIAVGVCAFVLVGWFVWMTK
jgi:hypothetical protein